MKSKFLILMLLASASISASEKQEKFRFIDFQECFQKSTYGEDARKHLEGAVQKLQEVVDDTKSQLEAVSKKLEDQDYVDGLSPDAEQALVGERQQLSERLNMISAQGNQALQYEQQAIQASLEKHLSEIAAIYGPENKLNAILPKQIGIYWNKALDITDIFIELLNKKIEEEKAAEASSTEKEEK